MIEVWPHPLHNINIVACLAVIPLALALFVQLSFWKVNHPPNSVVLQGTAGFSSINKEILKYLEHSV